MTGYSVLKIIHSDHTLRFIWLKTNEGGRESRIVVSPLLSSYYQARIQDFEMGGEFL